MPKINNLYKLIKQKSQELKRPLKIISDWDETLFSFRATAIYKDTKINMPFKQFFKEFWENASLEVKGQSASKVFDYNGTNEEIKEAYKKFLELEEERKKDPDKNSDKWQKINIVDDAPLLSIGEDIKRCLEEGLLSKLVVITTTRNSTIDEPSIIVLSKRERMARTFGKFPQSELGVMIVKKINGVNKPHRWEWIKENHPDFDVFIDDDAGWVKSVREHFPSDKIYVLPDYKNSFKIQEENIYHVKQEVSDIKNEDFEKVAEECQKNHQEKQQKAQMVQFDDK